jgi:hypothetical protein
MTDKLDNGCILVMKISSSEPLKLELLYIVYG